MQRREFITKGGLVSAGIITSSSALASVNNSIGKSKKVNLGIIGTGNRGRTLIKTLQQIKGINIVALCDIIPFRLKDAADRVGNGVTTYDDHKKLLDDKDVNAVLIVTPYSTHQSIAMDALNANKHVYCEKTMARGYDEIDALVKKVESSNLVFQTGHQYHSSRLYHHIIDIIKEGRIGKVIALNCKWFRKGNWRRTSPNPQYARLIDWRMYREYSGGMTAELSSHQIDFAKWLLGETPEKIMGTGGVNYWNDDRETFDNTNLIFEYPSGIKANFKCMTSNVPGGYEIEVVGDKGTIQIAMKNAKILYYEPYDKSKLIEIDGVSGATPDYEEGGWQLIKYQQLEPTKQALVDFRDAIYNGEIPLSNVRSGANTAIAVQMGVEAMLTGEAQYRKERYQY